MGLLDRIKVKKSENAINRVPDQFATGLWLWGNPGLKRYADAYLWLVFNKIFSGLENVRYDYDGIEAEAKLLELARFLETNIKTIVWEWWQWGFVCIGYDVDGRPYFPEYRDIKFDRDRNITNFSVTYLSPWYIYEGKSPIAILAENVNVLNKIKNSDDYLTTSLGAIGILSGKGFPIRSADKDEFLEKMRRDYGTTSDKKQILLMDSDVSFTQMNLPVKDLDLTGKVRDELKLISGFFNVPYDLIPFAGQSTYNNQREAVRQFYSNCISPLAEVGLTVGRYMMRKMKGVLVPSDRLTFHIDNVTELEDDRTAEIEYKLKVAELVKKMQDAGLDAGGYIEQLKK